MAATAIQHIAGSLENHSFYRQILMTGLAPASTSENIVAKPETGIHGYNSGMSFVWHTLKATANLQRHGVSFEEAQTVFRDPLAVIVDDQLHSEEDVREIIIGHSARGRLLFVCFTERGEEVRLISAREPTRQERERYEDNPSF